MLSRSTVLVLMIACTILMATPFWAQAQQGELEDVIYLKSGSVIRGTIVEQVPGGSVRIQTRDGNVMVYQMDDVARISKEAAPESESSRWKFIKGIKAGIWSPGEVWVDDTFSVDGDLSYSVGGFLDAQLGAKFHGGVAVNVADASIDGESAVSMDVALALKAMLFSGGEKLMWRPGFEIGYSTIGALGPLDSTAYLIVWGTLELVMVGEGKMSYLIEAAVGGAPTGGNDEYTITYGPGFRLRAGIMF